MIGVKLRSCYLQKSAHLNNPLSYNPGVAKLWASEWRKVDSALYRNFDMKYGVHC